MKNRVSEWLRAHTIIHSLQLRPWGAQDERPGAAGQPFSPHVLAFSPSILALPFPDCASDPRQGNGSTKSLNCDSQERRVN